MAKRNYPFYKLLKKKTGEWHLFGLYKVVNPNTRKEEWKITNQSICEKMDWSERVQETDSMNEGDLRLHAAKLGRVVCGSCISHLYLTLE